MNKGAREYFAEVAQKQAQLLFMIKVEIFINVRYNQLDN